MTEVLQPSPSHFSSPSSSSSTSPPCEISHQHHPNSPAAQDIEIDPQKQEIGDNICIEREERDRGKEGDQVSLIELLVDVFRRSMIGCSASDFGSQEFCSMEIGVPTNVRHVAHVTFDRFDGFLGLPVEFEPDVPRRAPSASTTVFGVSTESMQLSYDSRGNSVPTILLMMQRQLYARGGLQAEGVFRINAENSQEEYVRDQLNRGIIPEDIDVHCLAGLIKAWFRELPRGVLDSVSQEQVMQAQSEEECVELARLLPPTGAALLDWAINLMADVAQFEHLNKMNARNVAVVFAPNMTQMSDPLTALMYAVQVMNFLKTLVERTLREREGSVIESASVSRLDPSDEDGHQSSLEPSLMEDNEDKSEEQKVFVAKEPSIDGSPRPSQDDCQNLLASIENIPGVNRSVVDCRPCEVVSSQVSTLMNENVEGGFMSKIEAKRGNEQALVLNKGSNIVGSINPRIELFEAWR